MPHNSLPMSKVVAQRIGGKASTGDLSMSGKVTAEVQTLSVPSFLVVLGQLGLVLYAMHLFQVETATGFNRLFPLILGGFVVNAWLPARLRMPFFVGLSFVGIATIFGYRNSAWLIGIGLGLIGLCHLPASKWIRVSLVTLAGIGLTALRADLFITSWSRAILPVLGSMFMFRLALYLYDMDNEKKRASLWERLAYFFMLPNTVFPFFPIVDYIQFRRSYYDRDAIEIYQKGVLWMLRGAVHLILYRVVYYYFTPAVEEVAGLGGVVLFIVSAYLLYLRVSGLFHLIVGILCLFGFNLPETHKQYFLASGFNDYWRRINIYWKDFMMKLFFYPLYMKTRHWGATTALVFSTLVVFVCTWVLHSYQWFWLQGDFPLTTVDGVYWMVLGVLVAVNSVWETKRVKKKRLTREGFDAMAALKLTLKTVATFVFLALMWSFWSSESVGEWWTVMSAAGTSGLGAWLWVLLGLLGLSLLLLLKQWLESKDIELFFDERRMSFNAVARRTGVMALGLVVLGMPQVQGRLEGDAGEVLASIKEARLNARDAAMEERGYYEGLMDGRSYTSQLSWSRQPDNPEDWKPIMESDLVKPGEGVLIYELRPSLTSEYKTAPFSTNSFGMRDQEYALEKDSTTLRIALLGASYEQGAGVSNDEVYDAVLEDSLNAHLAGAPYEKYEVLNFAVGGYSPVQNVELARNRMKAFAPDVVLYAMYSTEERRMLMQMENIVQENRTLQYPFLTNLIETSGAKPEMEKPEIRALLDPHKEDLLAWSFGEIAKASREMGAEPIALMLPTTRELEGIDPHWKGILTNITEQAGFTVLGLDDAYAPHERAEVELAPWDQHPSVLGHQLVARRIYRAMREQPEVFGLGR